MSASRPSTVRQLLHSAKLGGAKVLGGEAGLDQVVTDVRLSATVTRTEVLPAGTLVILDGATLDDNAYVIDHALRILSEAGGAGLILADPRRHPDLGPARLANQFRVPFIVVEGVPAMELAHSLRATYWAAEVEQAAVIDRLLSDVSLMRHRDVDSFIVAIASIAHVPFSLIDRNRHPIVGTHISTSGRRLAETVGHLVDYGGDGALHSAPIVLASGEPVSYWLIAESKGPDAAYGVIRAVVQLGAWYLTSLLASARMRHEREARRRIAVLNELLDAGDRPELDLRNQLADMGWTVTGWNMGLHIKLGGSVDPGRVVDLHAEISQRLDAEGVRGPVVERTDGWSGWTTFAEEPSVGTYSDVTAAMTAALAGLVAAHPGLIAHAGIGRPHTDVAGLRRSLAEAHEASLIAVARIRGTSGAAHIDQLGVQRVLMGWFGSDEFKRFAHAMLEPLATADRDGTLRQTLEAYLDAAGSSSGAGQQLGVHRNTVANRIRRVEELLSVDLTDAEVRLSLQLASRMVRLSP